MTAEDDWIDDGINLKSLIYIEKSGHQIYRNYNRSLDDYAVKRFVDEIDAEPIDLSKFISISTKFFARMRALFP